MTPEFGPRPDDDRRPLSWAYRTGQVFGRHVLFPPLFDVNIRGLGNVPLKGGLIMAANHLSNFDPFILGAYTPRITTWVAKRELYRTLPLAVLLHMWGVVAVRRDGLDTRPLRQLLRLLADGGTVGMFPEGTRSRERGLQSPIAGAAYLGVKSGVPILPVGMWGAHTLDMHARVLRGRRSRVDINVGEPFTLDAPAGKLGSDALHQSGEVMMRRIATLLPEDLRGVYAASEEVW